MDATLNELLKGLKGEVKAQHKYLRREGGPGNYRYIYKDAQGREHTRTQAEHLSHHKKLGKEAPHVPKPNQIIVTKDKPKKQVVVTAKKPITATKQKPIVAKEKAPKKVTAAPKQPVTVKQTLHGSINAETNNRTNLLRSTNLKSIKDEAVKEKTHSHLNDINTVLDSMSIRLKDALHIESIGDIKAVTEISSKLKGQFYPGEKKVTVFQNDDVANTLTHEVIHGVDYSLGEGKALSAQPDKQGEAKEDFNKLFEVVKGTDLYTKETDQKHLNYLNKKAEIFARAMEVYVSSKAKELERKGKVSAGFAYASTPEVFKNKTKSEKESLEKQIIPLVDSILSKTKLQKSLSSIEVNLHKAHKDEHKERYADPMLEEFADFIEQKHKTLLNGIVRQLKGAIDADNE